MNTNIHSSDEPYLRGTVCFHVSIAVWCMSATAYQRYTCHSLDNDTIHHARELLLVAIKMDDTHAYAS